MPSQNKTSLGLNQWNGNEYPKRIDFNEDNKIIDYYLSSNKSDILTIKNELNKSVNTKYSTVNGIKEFNCKDGYVDNIYIEGETLVNLCYFPNSPNYSDNRFFQTFDNRISGYDTYTIFIPMIKGSGKDIGFEVYDQQGPCGHGFGVSSNKGMVVVNIPKECRIATIHCLKSDFTEEQLKQICETSMILPGDYTNKQIPYFEGLKSIGQGDKIEVLSCGDKITLPKFTWNDGKSITSDNGLEVSSPSHSYANEFIEIEDKLTYYGFVNANICFYNANKNIIPINWKDGINSKPSISYSELSEGYVELVPPSGARYVRINIRIENKQKISLFVKHDKKQINQTFRSLPNGVKDELVKKGNSYYKLQRCEEVILTGNEHVETNLNNKNTIGFRVLDIINSTDRKQVICDKFKWMHSDSDEEHIYCVGSGLTIYILKSKLSTQDIAGFKTWLKDNPVTVVYELAEPKQIPLPNFNPQTFSDKTTFLLNSGAVQGECDFEITNSLRSEVDIIKGKVSDLDSQLILDKNIEWIDFKPLNGITTTGNNVCLILKNKYSATLYAELVCNTLIPKGTTILKLPIKISYKQHHPLYIYVHGYGEKKAWLYNNGELKLFGDEIPANTSFTIILPIYEEA